MKNNYGIWLETTAGYCELCGTKWFVWAGAVEDESAMHADDCPIRIAILEAKQPD